MIALGHSLEDEAVDVLSGEAHLDPRARDRGLGHRRRDGVVERPVEVGQRDVDQDTRDGVGLGGLPRRGLPAPGGGRLCLRIVDGSTGAQSLDQRTPFPSLTRRERAVLALLAEGRSNPEIARELYLSEGTVKGHVSHLMTRLGCRNRTQLALRATERSTE